MRQMFFRNSWPIIYHTYSYPLRPDLLLLAHINNDTCTTVRTMFYCVLDEIRQQLHEECRVASYCQVAQRSNVNAYPRLLSQWRQSFNRIQDNLAKVHLLPTEVKLPSFRTGKHQQ